MCLTIKKTTHELRSRVISKEVKMSYERLDPPPPASHVKDAFGAWQWALRVTPGLGLICVALLLFCVREPSRGQSDGGRHLQASSSWLKDVKSLVRNRTYMMSTWGLTSVSFVAGALGYWTPYLTRVSVTNVRGHLPPYKSRLCT